MSYISQEDIFNHTDGGLDIILHYFPDADKCQNNNRKFKIRTGEKTASATLKKLRDGNWVVTDFGGDAKPKNCIAIVMEEERVDFATACKLIGERWNILPQERRNELLKPEIRKTPAQPDQEDGTWLFEIGDFTERDLLSIFADQVVKYVKDLCEKQKGSDDWETYLRKVCKRYFFHKLNSYSIIKNREVITISSTEHYPIFVFEVSHGGKLFKKVYQPLNPDKGLRFMYYGGKPDDHIFGLSQCNKRYDDLNSGTKENIEEEDSKPKEIKIPEIIYATGGSDALNVAALGYEVIWLNSETAKLHSPQYLSITKLCDKFMVLPDIDVTGKRAAHELCMVYLETRTIVLPPQLAAKKDWRGNACKDVRDYFKYWKRKDFDKLVQAALPYQFWDAVPQFDKQGKFKNIAYICNNTHLYFFLAQNGFYQFKTQNGQLDIYIQVTGNIVKEINAKQVRKFINDFLSERGKEVDLRNTFYRSTQLNSTSFENLPFTEIDFTDFDRDSQWMFFHNQTWQITPGAVTKFKPGEVKKYVWDDEVIDHRVELLEDFFKVSYTEASDEYSIEVLNKDCLFFQYLINTTRMHWKVEEYGVEDGQGGIRKELTEEEKREQDLHLINRLYVLGYLLHRYKDPSRPWGVWAMENEIIEDAVSDGGSGKSILMKYPRYFMKSETLPARDQRLTENKHLLENVNEHTDYVLVDDCHEFLNFAFFYPMITGEWHINPKNSRSFTLSYSVGPKIGFASNFAPKNVDPSTERRLLYTVFSDYYHHGPTEKHPEARTPKDEFGKNLFDDFTDDEWNRALNLGAQCVKLYLTVQEKINPPMANVTQRQLLAEMNEVFKNWADVFFGEIAGRLNTEVERERAMKEFFTVNNVKWTSQKFGKSMKAWCKFYGYKLNPKDRCNQGNRIISKVTYTDDGGNVKETTKEMIFIETENVQHLLPF